MNKTCSKCGIKTEYENDLHCRKILVDQIKELILDDKIEDIYKLLKDTPGNKYWENWKWELYNRIIYEHKKQQQNTIKEDNNTLENDINNGNTQNDEHSLDDNLLSIYEIIEKTSQDIFLTGGAGTGKSTLIKYFYKNTKKKVVILAPTGVAALNIGGETIHKFFNFKPDITLNKINNKYLDGENNIYKKLDTIIIDEISMVRADLLDCIDKFMRLNGKDRNKPFGGVQIIFVGDLYQLPPIVSRGDEELFNSHYRSPYIFDSKIFGELNLKFIKLDDVFRQKDREFIEILNDIRLGYIDDSILNKINERYIENHNNYDCLRLVPTNSLADEINNIKLGELKSKSYISRAIMNGIFESPFPANIELKIKEGARVIFIKNNNTKGWLNGDSGTITKIINDLYDESKVQEIIVKLDRNNRDVHITEKETWEKIIFFYNKDKKEIDTKIVGSFTQFPIRLAWAITIHKSQGMTYKNIIIDFSPKIFSTGQAYVALSRGQGLDGIFLTSRLKRNDILVDKRISDFMNSVFTENTTNSSKKVLDIFKDINENKIPTWAKFVNPGDSVQGTYINKIVNVIDGYGNEQIVYQLLKDDGGIINIGFSLSKKMLHSDMEKVKYGQIIGFKYKGLLNIDNKDIKDFGLYQDPSIINYEWVKNNQ